MKHSIYFVAFFACVFQSLYAQTEELSPEEYEFLQQIESDSIKGQTGAITLSQAHCTINVPDGFVYLDPEDAKHLLVDYWDNPEEKYEGVLGTLVSEYAGVFDDVNTAYIIFYSDAGYVSDEDAESIDYDELLKNIRETIEEENKSETSKQKWELVDWAWNPTYDKQKKVLGWARHYRVDGEDVVNYDVRVLGKAGYVIIKAVGGPEDKDELLAANSDIVDCVKYDKGYTYADFNPDTDHVAEWTIGGLVAGKVLAKVGFWAILAKYAKLIFVAIIGFFALIGKRLARLFGHGNNEE